jgi:hypothetical protein
LAAIIEVWSRLAKSAIFPGVPDALDPDHSAGDLVAHLMPTDDQASNLARKVALDPLAEPRMFDKALRCCCEGPDQLRGSGRINAHKKVVKATRLEIASSDQSILIAYDAEAAAISWFQDSPPRL